MQFADPAGARVTIEALASGASDYVAKPAGQQGREAGIRTLSQDVIPKIKALTRRAAQEMFGKPLPRISAVWPAVEGPGAPVSIPPKVVAIGVSTGGPAALDRILPALPGSFPLPVLVVQHMPEVFTALLAERLNGRCRLSVREAAEGDPIRPGTIFVARGNWHMEVLAAASAGAPPTLHLTQAPPKITADRSWTSYFAAQLLHTAAACWLRSLPEWGQTVWRAAGHCAQREERFTPRTRQPAQYGVCRAQ